MHVFIKTSDSFPSGIVESGFLTCYSRKTNLNFRRSRPHFCLKKLSQGNHMMYSRHPRHLKLRFQNVCYRTKINEKPMLLFSSGKAPFSVWRISVDGGPNRRDKAGFLPPASCAQALRRYYKSLLFPITENKYLTNVTMMDKMHATLPGRHQCCSLRQ